MNVKLAGQGVRCEEATEHGQEFHWRSVTPRPVQHPGTTDHPSFHQHLIGVFTSVNPLLL